MTPTRRLLVLRHAKSSWDDPGLRDHDRPLAARGRRDLPRLAAELRRRALDVEVVLCSSARRARDTLTGVRPALPEAVSVRVDERLYGAGAPELLALLRLLSDEVGTVMLVGHNPGLEDLLHVLVRTGTPEALSQLRTKVPTGALAELRLPGTWQQLRPGGGELVSMVVPRDLPG